MPRMFDMLRGKDGGDRADPGSEARRGQPLSFPKEILKAAERPEPREDEDHSLASKKLIVAVRQHGIDNQERADEVYSSAVGTVKGLLAKIEGGEDLRPYMDTLCGLLDTVFNQLVMGDNILANMYGGAREESSLSYHIVNVLILSSVIALSMGFNKSRLSHLGLASIFYDTGMSSFRKLSEEPRAFTAHERETVKGHIERSLEIVKKAGAVNDVVIETILMHHERDGGGGYPSGIRNDGINPYAKILALADTYEAITHARPYRDGMNTHKAVRLIIGSMKNDFDSDVMKIFINKMSVYPIGSIVTLDTAEVARVISVRPNSPLRPVIMILRDAGGVNVKEKTVIDLSKQDYPAIKD